MCKFSENNNKVTFYIHTLGCRVNQYESDAIAQELKSIGWVEIEDVGSLKEFRPNVAIVHTCAVTQEASRKSGQMIRRMRNRFNADLVVAIGCHVEIVKGNTAADLSLGNKDKNMAAKYIVDCYRDFLLKQDSESTSQEHGSAFFSFDNKDDLDDVDNLPQEREQDFKAEQIIKFEFNQANDKYASAKFDRGEAAREQIDNEDVEPITTLAKDTEFAKDAEFSKKCNCGKYDDYCHCATQEEFCENCTCQSSALGLRALSAKEIRQRATEDGRFGSQLETNDKGSERKDGFTSRGIVRAETLVCNLPDKHLEQELDFSDMGAISQQKGSRAYIKIQDGCDMKCTYCTINKVRGASRSRDFASIVQEAKTLVDAGYKDIVLTGIEVSAYGLDWQRINRENVSLDSQNKYHQPRRSLTDLLEELDKIDGVSRILLSSLDPRVASLDFVQRVAKMKNFGAHFHLSLQSGSTSVLRRMKRPYSSEFYAQAVERIYEYLPEANITTDVITGFPGETEQEHLESLLFCRKQRFSDFHVFPYSDRPGTEASLMSAKVDKEIAKSRLKEFESLRSELWRERASREVGHEHELLVEQIKGPLVRGYSKNYLPIAAESSALLRVGEVYKVLVNGYNDESLLATFYGEN